MTPPTRDELGEMVRDVWIQWAKEQDNPKPSWLVPYSDLSEPDKEADRLIGETLYGIGAMQVLLAQTSYPVEIHLKLKYKDLTIKASGWICCLFPRYLACGGRGRRGSTQKRCKTAGYASGLKLWAECEHDYSDSYLTDEELGVQVRAVQKRGREKVEVVK